MTNKRKSLEEIIAKSGGLYLMDSDLIPFIEKAENGCLDSQATLANAFCCGEGAKKNEELARYFEKLMFNNTDDNRVKLGEIWNPAIREYDRGNYDKMIEKFNIAIDFMQENIPMEKWDFSLFAIMEEYTQLRDDE